MRASISIGNYATTPYYVAGMEIPVYCIEELCYLIHENAVLMDQSIMVRSLVEWIGTECGLRELAVLLGPIVQRQGSLSTFVSIIMEYTGLYDNYEIEDIRHALKQGAGLTSIERHKRQIDYLVEKRKYAVAIKGYQALADKWNLVEQQRTSVLPGINVLAAIYHNMGVAYAGLMQYDRAAQCFEDSYHLEPTDENFQCFLAAKRMGMKDSDYISFAASVPDSYNASLVLERKMERLRKDWEQHPDAKRLELRRAQRDTTEVQKYYDENERIIRALKDSYRSFVEV